MEGKARGEGCVDRVEGEKGKRRKGGIVTVMKILFHVLGRGSHSNYLLGGGRRGRGGVGMEHGVNRDKRKERRVVRECGRKGWRGETLCYIPTASQQQKRRKQNN